MMNHSFEGTRYKASTCRLSSFSATNGEEALESFHRDSPDLIVLDVMLPKMDGFAVCRDESVVPIIF